LLLYLLRELELGPIEGQEQTEGQPLIKGLKRIELTTKGKEVLMNAWMKKSMRKKKTTTRTWTGKDELRHLAI
jgi:hypothetical protein